MDDGPLRGVQICSSRRPNWENAVPKITKRFVDAAAPRAERWIAWDDDLVGFGLAVLPSGVKSYVVRYRTAEALRDRRITVGRHGVLTPDQARAMAREILVAVAKGGDPAGDRREKRKGATMAELFERYLEEHVAVHCTPKTGAEVRRLVEKHLSPAVGALKVEGFTNQDARRVHYSMRATPGSANRALAALSKALALAEEWGMRAEGLNPCARVRKFPEKARDRFLSPDELTKLGAVLIDAETVGLPWVVDETKPKAKHLARPENRVTPMDGAIVAVVRLLLLTGARRSEITELQWSHVDFDARTIALPRQKGRERRPHVVSGSAMDIIARRQRVDGSPWVFPRAGDPTRCIAGEVVQNGWDRIRTAAGLADVHLHDLRHTFGTTASRTGANAFQIRDSLRHANVTMSSRYVNADNDPLRLVAETVGEALTAALDGRKAEVVAIGRGQMT